MQKMITPIADSEEILFPSQSLQAPMLSTLVNASVKGKIALSDAYRDNLIWAGVSQAVNVDSTGHSSSGLCAILFRGFSHDYVINRLIGHRRSKRQDTDYQEALTTRVPVARLLCTRIYADDGDTRPTSRIGSV